MRSQRAWRRAAASVETATAGEIDPARAAELAAAAASPEPALSPGPPDRCRHVHGRLTTLSARDEASADVARPTMRDVASTAGVSVKTVSRVVNGERGVRAETAARVDAAIGRLGFTRNDLASSLRSGRAGALGLSSRTSPTPSTRRSRARSRTPPTRAATSSSRAPARRTRHASASSRCGCCAGWSTRC